MGGTFYTKRFNHVKVEGCFFFGAEIGEEEKKSFIFDILGNNNFSRRRKEEVWVGDELPKKKKIHHTLLRY